MFQARYIPRNPTRNTATRVLDLLLVLRPKQWTKNLLVFASLLLSGEFFHPASVLRVTQGFAVFCLISSIGYIVNDVLDAERDRLHPKKARRPIAAGHLSRTFALAYAACLLLGAYTWAYTLGIHFFICALIYLASSVSYSLYFKHQPIIDVCVLSIGFILRAVAGSALLAHLSVNAYSSWFILTVSLLSIFLGFAKRRDELYQYKENAGKHRETLNFYSLHFLDQIITMLAAVTIVCYSMAALSSPFGLRNPEFAFTIAPMLYGIFRYLYLVLYRNKGGNPEDLLISDRQLTATVVCWIALVVLCFFI